MKRIIQLQCSALLALAWLRADISPVAAQPQSDFLSVMVNGKEIGPGGIAEGTEVIQVIPLGVNANVQDRTLVLTEPNGDASDVVRVVRVAGNAVQLIFTSDTGGAIIPPDGAVPIAELVQGQNITRDLFPNFMAGMEPAQVFVRSDPDETPELVLEPEALGPFAIGAGLAALLAFARGRYRLFRA